MSDEATPEAPQPSEMALLRAEMRTGFQSIAQRLDGVDRRFDGVDKRFDEVDKSFDEVDKRFDQVDERFAKVDERFVQVDERFLQVDGRRSAFDTRFDALDARISDETAATRRHFDVVAEGIRADMKVVIDKTISTGEKVDRLIASNSVEHAAFLDALTDHEVRIARLESATGLSKPPAS